MELIDTDVRLPGRLGLAPLPKGQTAAGLLGLMSRLRSAAFEEDWAAVLRLGGRCLGDGYAGIRMLQIRSERAAGRPSRSGDEQGLLRVLQVLAGGEQSEQVIERARTRWGGSQSALLQSALQSLEAVHQGRTEDLPLIQRMRSSPPPSRSSRPARITLEHAVIAALVRGLLALTQAEFQLKLGSLRSPREAKTPPPDAHDGLAKATESVQTTLERLQQRIFFEISTGGSLQAAESVDSLIGFIERSLPRFAALQAGAYLEMEALREAGRGTAAERLGRLAARAGALNREALASQAAAYRILLEREREEPSEEMEDLVRRAPTSAFAARMPNGRNTDIAKIPSLKDGEFVEFGGFVQSVQAGRDRAGKLIGTARLLDPSSGAEVSVATPFTHLPHIGLTRGAFCEVNGYYRERSDLLADEPGVEIDRLPLSKLAQESWKLRWLRTADDWYQCWHNGASIRFSPGPQRAAEDEQGVNEYGAGELIYSPFVRR